MKKKKIELCMAIIIIMVALMLSKRGAEVISSTVANFDAKDAKVVLIDPGHGGSDPGKVGINDALEKDINLEIALKLEKALKKEGITVVMSRKKDEGLSLETSDNHKAEDMKKRCDLIAETNPICAISIHQNSYPEEYVKGAQVFYYGTSSEGKILAEVLQAQLISHIDKTNTRQAKANESYYILKKTTAPTVIVECGFLSNWEEAKLLVTKKHQDKVVEAICAGILEYLKEK